MKRFSIKYTFLTYRYDQLWLPFSIWGLFIVICLFAPVQRELMNITQGYLGTVVPLIGGIMAAYVILEDPSLELRFATPISTSQTLIERLCLIFVIQAVTALSFQLFALRMGGDFSIFLSFWHLQLAWILPTATLMVVGCMSTLIAAQTTTGAMTVGLIWIIEVIARGWLAENNGKYFLVFMGALMPDHPDLMINHISVFALCLIFLFFSWMLLHRQERYI